MNFSPQITQITQKGNGHKKAQKSQKGTKQKGTIQKRNPMTDKDFPLELFVPFCG
jgi:hypothetical protein